jgi:hypothetical protein
LTATRFVNRGWPTFFAEAFLTGFFISLVLLRSNKVAGVTLGRDIRSKAVAVAAFYFAPDSSAYLR